MNVCKLPLVLGFVSFGWLMLRFCFRFDEGSCFLVAQLINCLFLEWKKFKIIYQRLC